MNGITYILTCNLNIEWPLLNEVKKQPLLIGSCLDTNNLLFWGFIVTFLLKKHLPLFIMLTKSMVALVSGAARPIFGIFSRFSGEVETSVDCTK